MNAGQQRLAVAAELAKENEQKKKKRQITPAVLHANRCYAIRLFSESFAMLAHSLDGGKKNKCQSIY